MAIKQTIINKTVLGLSNVDNTTDLLKPISTATQTALNLKQDKSSVATHTLVAGTATTSQIIRINDQSINSDINVDSIFSITPTKDSSGKIILPLSSVRYGITAPLIITTDRINDTYLRTDTGLSNGALLSEYIYDGTAWKLVNTIKDSIVDVTVVTPLPLVFPLTILPGSPVFTPNIQNDIDTIYRLPDGTVFGSNGTQYIGNVPVPTNYDFFRSGPGVGLPNGVIDDIENISRSGKMGLGLVDATQVTATLDVRGTISNKPLIIASVPFAIVVNAINKSDVTSSFEITTAQIEANSAIEVTDVFTDTYLYLGTPASYNATNIALLKGRYLKIINSERSTHRLYYKEFEIQPGKFVDLIHNGKEFILNTDLVEIYEGYEFIGTDVIIPLGVSGTTTYIDVPGASFVAPIAGDYEVKYTFYASNGQAIMQTRAGNDIKFVTDNIVGTFTLIDGSISEIGTDSIGEIRPYTKYFRVRTIRPNQIIKMQLNSILGSTNWYQSPTQLSKIQYKRYNSLPTILPTNLVKKYRIVQNLVAGNNTITHNLALLTPFATVVEVRDNLTGALIATRVITELTNTLIINVTAPVINATITIIG